MEHKLEGEHQTSNTFLYLEGFFSKLCPLNSSFEYHTTGPSRAVIFNQHSSATGVSLENTPNTNSHGEDLIATDTTSVVRPIYGHAVDYLPQEMPHYPTEHIYHSEMGHFDDVGNIQPVVFMPPPPNPDSMILAPNLYTQHSQPMPSPDEPFAGGQVSTHAHLLPAPGSGLYFQQTGQASEEMSARSAGQYVQPIQGQSKPSQPRQKKRKQKRPGKKYSREQLQVPLQVSIPASDSNASLVLDYADKASAKLAGGLDLKKTLTNTFQQQFHAQLLQMQWLNMMRMNLLRQQQNQQRNQQLPGSQQQQQQIQKQTKESPQQPSNKQPKKESTRDENNSRASEAVQSAEQPTEHDSSTSVTPGDAITRFVQLFSSKIMWTCVVLAQIFAHALLATILRVSTQVRPRCSRPP